MCQLDCIMARKPDYGQLASNLSAAFGSLAYGAGHVMEYDILAQIDSTAAAAGLGVLFIVTGGKTVFDKVDELR